MAEKRMFSEKVVGSDAFTEMSPMAQILYFHLNMHADDDGFVNSPKKIARSIGATDKDLDTLISKRFLIRFPSGIVVIKHWRINNTIRPDRYKPTEYQSEFSQLIIKQNKSYTEKEKHPELIPEEPEGEPVDANLDTSLDTNGIPSGNQLSPQDRKGEDRRDQNRGDKNRSGGKHPEKQGNFKPPTLEEIKEFCQQRDSPVDPNRFYDFFEAGNWIDTKGNPVRNWKQKFITWERKEVERNGGKSSGNEPVHGQDDGSAGTEKKNYGFHYDV